MIISNKQRGVLYVSVLELYYPNSVRMMCCIEGASKLYYRIVLSERGERVMCCIGCTNKLPNMYFL